MRKRSQTKIGGVLTKKNPILSPRGKHPIGFIYTLIDQVVDQNANISLITAKDKRFLLRKLKMGVDTGHQALCSGFFVTRGTIDLSCQEKARNDTGFQRIMQILWIEIIVFYRISRLENDSIFEAGDSMKCLQLDIQGKGRREPLKIILRTGPALRFQEKLVGILIGKGTQLVFDGRTIPRPTTMDHPGKQGRTIEAGTKDVMDLFVRMKDKALHLGRPGLDRRRAVQERETGRSLISNLGRERREVDGPDIDPGRGSRFHTSRRNSKRSELIRDPVGRRLADPSAFEGMLPDEHPTVQEGSGRQNNRTRMENCPGNRTDAGQNAVLKEKIFG